MENLTGGYYGEDDGGTIEEYYEDCINSIEYYGFDHYDRKLFKDLREKAERKQKKLEKARKKKWEKTYTLVYDPSIPNHAVKVDKSIIKGGTVQIWIDEEMQGIYDAIPGQKGKKIGISDPRMDGMKVNITVNEQAKG